MVDAKGAPFRVVLTTDQQAAIKDAAYVTTQLRVGQMEARRNDEYLGKRHHLIGQETTGIGGMAKALRTVPVILKIAQDMREFAPSALLVNFTNPSGLVTQALSDFASDISAVGVCNGPITTKMMIINELERATGIKINPNHTTLDTFGAGSLAWNRGFILEREDVWDK